MILPKHLIEEKIKATGRRRRPKQLLGDLKGKGEYCNLKEKSLDSLTWRIHFEGPYGHVVRQAKFW